MTDTEHNTISGSNKVVEVYHKSLINHSFQNKVQYLFCCSIWRA